MERCKVSAVTGVTVTRRCLANGNADPGTGCGIMTGYTCIMGVSCCTYQRCISMAVSTLRTRGGYETGMIWRRGQMRGLPRACMARCAVAAGGKSLTDG